MGVRLSAEARPIELSFVWEAGSLPERVELCDMESARSFLARLSMEGHAAALRRVAESRGAGPRDDAETIGVLARMIVSGRLVVRRGLPFRLPAFDVEEDQPAPGEPILRAPLPPAEEGPPPEEEALPPVTVDGSLQAATLRRAAEKGIPFCEECEKKARKKAPVEDDTAHLDQAAMARTLIRAAQEGAPVCEECAKRKKSAPDKPPPPPPEDEDEDEEDEPDEDEASESAPQNKTP